MKNARKLVVAVIGILFLTGASLACAAGGPPRGGHFRQFQLLRMLERVNLTDAQVDKIADILSNSRTATAADRDALRAYRKTMVRFGKNAEFNEAEVRKAFAQVAPHLENLAVARARLRADIMGVLTSEQRAKLKKDFERKRTHLRQEWRLRKLFMESRTPGE